MIRTIIAASLAAVAVLPIETARAEGLIFHLPEDGTWAQFDMIQVKGLVDRNSGKTLIKDRVTRTMLKVSSVGTATVEKKICRWIEIKVQETRDQSEEAILVKVLIPEEHLQKGGDPAGNIMHGWIKSNDAPPRPIKENSIPVQMLVAGPQQEITKLDPIVVDCKAGKLKCDGLSGTRAWKDDNDRDFKTAFELRLHKLSPFGVAWWRSETEHTDQVARMTIKVTSSLNDSGNGAASELPDNN